MIGGMSLSLGQVVALLETIAPLRFAADWDNVGLLVESAAEQAVSRVMCTVELGEDVLAEAIELGAALVVAYHPPIFRGLKRLTSADAGERTVLGAIRSGIAVYAPHTALDAAPGGVNDWLAEALGPGERAPIDTAPDQPDTGMGRRVTLAEPASLEVLVARIKQHLGLAHVRVAAATRHRAGAAIADAAVCAGAGGSLFEKLRDPELYLTGEMRHHDVREKVAAGASVVLCDHTNTERGYLPRLAARLQALSDNALDVRVSVRDRDPLEIV